MSTFWKLKKKNKQTLFLEKKITKFSMVGVGVADMQRFHFNEIH